MKSTNVILFPNIKKNQKEKYRNRREWVLLVVIASFSVILSIILFRMATSGNQVVYALSQYAQVPMTVSQGQTAWEIQHALTPNIDERNALYLDTLINHQNMGNLIAGQRYFFLIQK